MTVERIAAPVAEALPTRQRRRIRTFNRLPLAALIVFVVLAGVAASVGYFGWWL